MRFSLALIFIFCGQVYSQVPAIGNAQLLEIANWNIEWFGNTSNGPSDETLQKKNVLEVLQKTKLDIWGLCEVSSSSAWDSLLANMPGYGGAISTWSQTQKTAFLYNKSTCSLLTSGNILNAYAKDFANGRTPLQATFVYTNNNRKDTITLLLLHLKSNVGTDSLKKVSYYNRESSANILKSYLDTFGKNKNIMVLGDWNDDLDTSVYSNWATPFTSLLNDTLHYYFPTQNLTKKNVPSTAGYPSFIDHQMLNQAFKKYWMRDSCATLPASKWIPNYAATTSDHFPVYSVYQFGNAAIQPARPAEKNRIYDNGIFLTDPAFQPGNLYQIFTPSGKLFWEGSQLQLCRQLPGGYYIVRIYRNGKMHAETVYKQ